MTVAEGRACCGGVTAVWLLNKEGRQSAADRRQLKLRFH